MVSVPLPYALIGGFFLLFVALALPSKRDKKRSTAAKNGGTCAAILVSFVCIMAVIGLAMVMLQTGG